MKLKAQGAHRLPQVAVSTRGVFLPFLPPSLGSLFSLLFLFPTLSFPLSLFCQYFVGFFFLSLFVSRRITLLQAHGDYGFYSPLVFGGTLFDCFLWLYTATLDAECICTQLLDQPLEKCHKSILGPS